MTEDQEQPMGIEIMEANSLAERESLFPILEESFEGWYLSHSKRTLRDIDKVFFARVSGKSVGVVMLKKIEDKMGYVYYIAVLPEFRQRKIGRALLDYSVSLFSREGCHVVFASLTVEHGGESKALFLSSGFVETSFHELSKKYGRFRTINLYRKMLVVSGELVVYKQLNEKLVD
jgi:ribosomal protein S18 acetylase RimI-like enzyme